MMNILFIGVGFFPWLTSGEKNFFLKLFPIIQQKTDVVVFSLNDYSEDLLLYETPDGDIPVYCVRRPFHRNYEQFFFFHANGYTSYHHLHKPPREILEKLLSTVRHLPQIKKIIKQHNVEIVHFMDNFGPSMPFLRSILPKEIKVTYSAANYDPRGSQANYDRYLKFSLGRLDGLGVYTQAYANKLNQLGIKTPCFLTPWGVPVANKPLSDEQKRIIRNDLGIGKDQYLILWSGYLQQIQEFDFYKTIQVARQIIQTRPDITFIFAFKPETFKEKYMTESGERIKVISGVKQFGDILETADLFCSLISNARSTVSPPLTWLEAMSKGTPVITTHVGGVEEIISHGENGYIADTYDDVADIIIQQAYRDNLIPLSKRARKTIQKHYTVQHAADNYLNMWQQLLSK